MMNRVRIFSPLCRRRRAAVATAVTTAVSAVVVFVAAMMALGLPPASAPRGGPLVAAAFMLRPPVSISATTLPSAAAWAAPQPPIPTLSPFPTSFPSIHGRRRPTPTTTTTAAAAAAAAPAPSSPQIIIESSNGEVQEQQLQQQQPQQKEAGEDSIEEFERDVAVVLKQLRPGERDPTIPPLFRNDLFPSFCHTWTLKDWDVHATRWRYVRFVLYFPTSRLLRRVMPQLSVIVGWSALVCYLFGRSAVSGGAGLLNRFSLPLTPLSLVSTFVAALLTLRSNQGLDRLNMGRLSFGKVVLYTRDTASLIVSTIYPKRPQLALKLLRHVALYGWLLKGFLRGREVNGDDHDIVTTMLGRDPADVQYVLAQRKAPMAVVMRLRQVVQIMSDRHELNTAEELALDHAIQELNHCLMTTERIRASPIPPLYTSHTGRLLMFYLFFLPLALCGSGMMNMGATVLTTAATAYAMLGLDEISFLLEQPFRLMPLFQLCKNSMMDVADTATIRVPALPSLEAQESRGCSSGSDGGDSSSPAAAAASSKATEETGAAGRANASPRPAYW